MNPLGVAELTIQPRQIIRLGLLICLAIRPAFFLSLIQCLSRGAELLLMLIIFFIKLPQHLARLHHGSAVQTILAAELFLLFILGREIGDDAFVRRADLFLAAEAVQIPLLTGARRRAVLPGAAPGNKKPAAEFALFDVLIR